MDISKEQIKDFKEHIVWREMETWFNERKEDTKNRLLTAKGMDEVIRYQERYNTYNSILSKLNNLEKKDQS